MSQDRTVDYYETLQVSANAEPETIHRVYRLLAQRFHPDNRETGNETRFREIHDAYSVLRDPEQRARFDIARQQHCQDRWRLVSSGADANNNFEFERIVRLTVLEALYTRRRMEPGNPGIYSLDLEILLGRPREHLQFTVWYLTQKKLVQLDDNSRLAILAAGVEYLERNYRETVERSRLGAADSSRWTAETPTDAPW